MSASADKLPKMDAKAGAAAGAVPVGAADAVAGGGGDDQKQMQDRIRAGFKKIAEDIATDATITGERDRRELIKHLNSQNNHDPQMIIPQLICSVASFNNVLSRIFNFLSRELPGKYKEVYSDFIKLVLRQFEFGDITVKDFVPTLLAQRSNFGLTEADTCWRLGPMIDYASECNHLASDLGGMLMGPILQEYAQSSMMQLAEYLVIDIHNAYQNDSRQSSVIVLEFLLRYSQNDYYKSQVNSSHIQALVQPLVGYWDFLHPERSKQSRDSVPANGFTLVAGDSGTVPYSFRVWRVWDDRAPAARPGAGAAAGPAPAVGMAAAVAAGSAPAAMTPQLAAVRASAPALGAQAGAGAAAAPQPHSPAGAEGQSVRRL